MSFRGNTSYIRIRAFGTPSAFDPSYYQNINAGVISRDRLETRLGKFRIDPQYPSTIISITGNPNVEITNIGGDIYYSIRPINGSVSISIEGNIVPPENFIRFPINSVGFESAVYNLEEYKSHFCWSAEGDWKLTYNICGDDGSSSAPNGLSNQSNRQRQYIINPVFSTSPDNYKNIYWPIKFTATGSTHGARLLIGSIFFRYISQ